MVQAEAIPAKLFYYFKTNKPILVIGPDGCEKMIGRIKRGLADAGAIADAVKLLLEKQANFALTSEIVSEFKK